MGTLTATLNGHPVELLGWTLYAPQVEYVRSHDAVRVDPTWTHTDPAGHEHRSARVDDRDTFPTLRRLSAHVHCNGSCGDFGCEGYDTALYVCRECAAWVRPRYVPDRQMREVGIPIRTGPARAELVVNGYPRAEEFVVLLRQNDRELRGRGWQVERRSDMDGWSYTVDVALEL